MATHSRTPVRSPHIARKPQSDAGVRRALQIGRNEALRKSPAELRNALALAQAHTVILDYEDEADLTGPEDDDPAFEEMDGEESPGENKGAAEHMGYLGSGGSLEVRDHAGPFLDLSLVYAISVIPERNGESAHCQFEPPAWFGRVRSQGGQDAVQRLSCVVSAVAKLLSEQFAVFLGDPTPASFSWCEWKYLAENRFSFRKSAILRKGLMERLNALVDAIERIDEPSLGALLPRIWLLWPDPLLAPSEASVTQVPIAMPLSSIYERKFQLDVAAGLSRGVVDVWPQLLSTPPKKTYSTWRQDQMSQPVKTLDPLVRVHLLAKELHVAASELFLAAASGVPFNSEW
ncbi:MAG: hypothetical protein WCK63_17920 [Betaproteobacteria bacterium]